MLLSFSKMAIIKLPSIGYVSIFCRVSISYFHSFSCYKMKSYLFQVEQVVMDENMVQIYDLLYQYCEFVVINLPYIRKHRYMFRFLGDFNFIEA